MLCGRYVSYPHTALYEQGSLFVYRPSETETNYFLAILHMNWKVFIWQPRFLILLLHANITHTSKACLTFFQQYL